MKEFPISGNASRIIGMLRKNGKKALVAGGCVRDFLLGCHFSDVDILTDASLDEVERIFHSEKTRRVGKTFSLCLVNGVEVASSRDQPHASDFPGSDLEKRDLTINSMAYDPETQTLFDPFQGKTDLAKGIIRFTNDPEQRISEDPLRILRAQRFVSQIEKSVIESRSLNAIKTFRHLLKTAARERMKTEVLKVMAHPCPSRFFTTLHETGTLADLFPSLEKCVGLDGGPYHGETVFKHLMIVGDAISPAYPLLRLAGFLHDAGKLKAGAIKDGRLSFAGHETQTEDIVSDLQRLKFSRAEISYISSLICVHMRPLNEETTPKGARRLLAFLSRHDIQWRDFMRLRIADKKGNLAKTPYTLSQIKTRVDKLLRELSPSRKMGLRVEDLAVTGRDIMNLLDIPEGPEVGRIKNYLFRKVLEEPSLNSRPNLEKLISSFYRAAFSGLVLGAAFHSTPPPL